MADPKEVFAVYDCEDVELYRFIRPLHIQYSPIPNNWSSLGGTPESIITPTTHIGGHEQILWYRKLYDSYTAAFLEVPEMLLQEDDGIPVSPVNTLKANISNKYLVLMQAPIHFRTKNNFMSEIVLLCSYQIL